MRRIFGETSQPLILMKKVSTIARYLLALVLLIFGLNKFLDFMPALEYSPTSAATAYMVGIGGVNMFTVLGILYIITAAMLGANKLVGLATMIVAPIAFNILLFHFTLDPAGSVAGIVLTVLLLLVMVEDKKRYQALLS